LFTETLIQFLKSDLQLTLIANRVVCNQCFVFIKGFKMRKIDLVIIDPQNSFCKVVPQADQQVIHDGELCVPGAWESMAVRLPKMIEKSKKMFKSISVTLDSHNPFHIAHPCLYKDSKGNQPSPFTIMRQENGSIIGSVFNASTNQFVDVGEYFGIKPSLHKIIVEYLIKLKALNKFPHCIWPPHCLIGTSGHNVVQPLAQALFDWTQRTIANVDYVTKGSNPFVEHFSAVKAEVEDPGDLSTQLNTDFIKKLDESDEIVFAGEARSHCLNNTVRDIVDSFSDDSFVKKCVLLLDACDDVPGFESYGESFVKDMTARGMRVAQTTDYV
jgi:nicotinamidase-related amidase